MKLVSDAVIVGTKGTIKVRGEKMYSVPHNKTSVMIKEQFCNKKSCGLFPLQLPHHMWCPTELEVNGKEMHFPLPETDLPLNYVHSAGLRYEGEEVRRCLLKGTN